MSTHRHSSDGRRRGERSGARHASSDRASRSNYDSDTSRSYRYQHSALTSSVAPTHQSERYSPPSSVAYSASQPRHTYGGHGTAPSRTASVMSRSDADFIGIGDHLNYPSAGPLDQPSVRSTSTGDGLGDINDFVRAHQQPRVRLPDDTYTHIRRVDDARLDRLEHTTTRSQPARSRAGLVPATSGDSRRDYETRSAYREGGSSDVYYRSAVDRVSASSDRGFSPRRDIARNQGAGRRDPYHDGEPPSRSSTWR